MRNDVKKRNELCKFIENKSNKNLKQYIIYSVYDNLQLHPLFCFPKNKRETINNILDYRLETFFVDII